MDLSLSDEQKALADSLNRYLTDNYDFDKRTAWADSERGFSDEQWKQYAELGWLAVPFSESEGGLGYTAVETMILMQEFGKALVLEPWLSTVVLGGGFLRHAAAERRDEVLPKIIGGDMHCAFAGAEQQSRFNPANVRLKASKSGSGWTLSGDKTVVLDGPSADLLIVSARSGGADDCDRDGISLFAVDVKADGVSLRNYRTFDGGRASEVSLRDVEVGPQDLIGEEGRGFELIERVLADAVLCLGAQAVGCMEIVQADTLEYARTREQFGVPIASFQVLQHRMVDMFMELEQSRSVLYMAAVRASDGSPDSEVQRAVSALKAQTGRAGRFVGQQAVQIHGGMGVTEELRLGHYFMRLTALEQTFGNTDYHLRRFAAIG